jgi:lysozyme family protein
MQENLKPSLVWCRANEGGFALRPPLPDGTGGEPGGAVNRGVSMLVLEEYCKKHGMPPPTIDDLRKLTDANADAIYEEMFAKPIRFDELPAGLDFVMLDTAIMEGVKGSILLLQQALDLKSVTGALDIVTWQVVTRCDVQWTVAKLIILHMSKKMHSPSVSKFGPGWGDRIVRRTNHAKAIMA